jgi:hypothetical protein
VLNNNVILEMGSNVYIIFKWLMKILLDYICSKCLNRALDLLIGMAFKVNLELPIVD